MLQIPNGRIAFSHQFVDIPRPVARGGFGGLNPPPREVFSKKIPHLSSLQTALLQAFHLSKVHQNAGICLQNFKNFPGLKLNPLTPWQEGSTPSCTSPSTAFSCARRRYRRLWLCGPSTVTPPFGSAPPLMKS